MVVRLNRLAIATIVITAPLVVTQQAIAQEVIVPGYTNTLPEAINDAYFSHDVDFYRNRSFGEQLDWIFGVGGRDGGFLENEIARDGRAITEITADLLFQQSHSAPIIRTADLPNPFSASLQTMERIDPLAPVPLPPATRITPAQPAPPPVAPGAVPALW
jgi:hypothetical protein